MADPAAYLANEKVGAVPIVGHSMGGVIAPMIAPAHPDLAAPTAFLAG